MSNFVEPRSTDELEGTLLPVAYAVPSNATEPLLSAHTADAIPVTSATPASYFEYEREDVNQGNGEQDQAVRIAAAVPLVDGLASSGDAQVDAQLARGERHGLIDTDSEIQDIQRANRKAYATDYFARKKIEEGNRRAARLSREENRQGWSGPTTELNRAAPPPATAPPAKPSPKKGTFGKEYQVAEYDVKPYDTGYSYETQEYKSMYDS